jgi:hypothetical protein
MASFRDGLPPAPCTTDTPAAKNHVQVVVGPHSQA